MVAVSAISNSVEMKKLSLYTPYDSCVDFRSRLP
jgi:hypothetical protein